jgi:hypothetical protein
MVFVSRTKQDMSRHDNENQCLEGGKSIMYDEQERCISLHWCSTVPERDAMI